MSEKKPSAGLRTDHHPWVELLTYHKMKGRRSRDKVHCGWEPA